MHSGGGGKASASREQGSPPRVPFAAHQGANAPPAAPAAHLPLFDRLRAARDSAGDQHLQRVQSLRQQREVQHEQKEVQKRIREVEVRAMQEVVSLRQSLAAAQLDAQEQRRQLTSVREQMQREERLVRTPDSQREAVDAAVRHATERGEAALERQRAVMIDEQNAAVEKAVAAALREASAETERTVASVRSEADAQAEGATSLRRELIAVQKKHVASEAAAGTRATRRLRFAPFLMRSPCSLPRLTDGHI